MAKRSKGGLVYSTDAGRICPGCRRAEADCVCAARDQARSTGDGIVRVERQTRGRKGAGVTRVTGVPGNAVQLAALAKSLKQLCGVGGAVKDGVIELQGDQRDRLVVALSEQGFTVRKAGG